MTPTMRFGIASAALYGLLFSATVHATDVSTRPLKADVLVKPNVIFAMDDSGSMDWELLLDTNSGVLQWNTGAQTAWDAQGRPRVGVAADYNMNYLFPNGTGTGGMQYGETNTNGRAVPPSPQFATMRSSAYNPLYYDPSVTYHPWPDAYHDGALRTYGNVSPSSAPSHPAVSGSITMNLTANQTRDILYRTGMMLPDGTTASSDQTVSTTYYPATYWVIDPTCSPTPGWGATCTTAPDNQRIRRVEIKPGNTFPSNRTYNDEIQNFANWWSYYRKRRLMLAGSMGQVLEGLSGMRLGLVAFNNRNTVTMYDADNASVSNNARVIAGRFYTNPASGSTPTATTLQYVGDQFKRTSGSPPVQYACQRNAAFVVTDGFANGNPPTPPSYSAAATNSDAFPYQQTYANSLADIALSYYTNNLRPDLISGRVPPGDEKAPPSQNADLNTNIHMNTYGISLGVKGTVWPMPAGQNPWTNPFAWPQPQADMPTSIDDLWHATINGRGQMYIASDATNTALRVQEGLNDILSNVGAQSSVAVSSINLRRGDGKAYLGTYNPRRWAGDITAHAIDSSNGDISSTKLWSASDRLLAKDWTTRVIATHNGSIGVPFTAGNVGNLVNPGGQFGSNTEVMNYLRGDRTGENTVPAQFRQRSSLIAAVINARPAVEDGVVFAASSEGMLHALDANTGEELWAYVPGSALSEMGNQTRRTWSFETYLDGSPMIYTVGTKKILVAGRGAAGPGYYALDVTAPKSIASEGALAARVLWEVNTGGLALGKPIIVETSSHGAVVLLSQGYNGATDGRGRLQMRDALTGALIHTFEAPGGLASGDPGLAQVTPLYEKTGRVIHVYGGDERGNLWKFNLDTKTTTRIAQLFDAGGARQPITSAPAIVHVKDDGGNQYRVVLVGTGRLLGLTDMGSSSVQSFYAIKDAGAEVIGRSALYARTLGAEDADGERDLGGPEVNWAEPSKRGWYFDMPAGQQANTDVSVVFGAAVFTTNMASMADCSASSFLYVIDIKSGGNVAAYGDSAGMTYASKRIGNFTVSGVTPLGYDGKGSHDLGVAFQRSTSSGGGGAGGRPIPCTAHTCREDLNIPQKVPTRKNAWRQIQR